MDYPDGPAPELPDRFRGSLRVIAAVGHSEMQAEHPSAHRSPITRLNGRATTGPSTRARSRNPSLPSGSAMTAKRCKTA